MSLSAKAFGIDRERCTHPELGDTEWHLFVEHFSIFPWDTLGAEDRGFEIGTGTGLWATLLAQKFAHVYGIDHRAEPLVEAERHGAGLPVSFHRSDFDAIDAIAPESCQWGCALESLHHAADVERALRVAGSKLVAGAPLLIYLRYLPEGLAAQLRARAEDLVQKLRGGEDPDPRYSRADVRALFARAGFERVRFVEQGSFWTAVGFKRSA